MLAAETLIAWNRAGYSSSRVPPGSVAVGPLLSEDEGDWTDGYLNTGGAANMYRRSLSAAEQKLAVIRDFYSLVYTDGLNPYVVHRAFLHIDEYQEFIKEMGAGPAPDEIGYDPEISYGRSDYPVPEVVERRLGRSVHVWPTT